MATLHRPFATLHRPIASLRRPSASLTSSFACLHRTFASLTWSFASPHSSFAGLISSYAGWGSRRKATPGWCSTGSPRWMAAPCGVHHPARWSCNQPPFNPCLRPFRAETGRALASGSPTGGWRVRRPERRSRPGHVPAAGQQEAVPPSASLAVTERPFLPGTCDHECHTSHVGRAWGTRVTVDRVPPGFAPARPSGSRCRDTQGGPRRFAAPAGWPLAPPRCSGRARRTAHG